MKRILVLLVAMASSYSALAQETNYCEYGSFQQGVTRFEFTEKPLQLGRYREFNTLINDQIKVSVFRSAGHLVQFGMLVNYKDGEVVIEDRYTDSVGPFRYLNIFARFNGLNLACYFKPDF